MPIEKLNVREDVIKWARLEQTTKKLLDIFEAGQEKNAELINSFFHEKKA